MSMAYTETKSEKWYEVRSGSMKMPKIFLTKEAAKKAIKADNAREKAEGYKKTEWEIWWLDEERYVDFNGDVTRIETTQIRL